MGRVKFSPKAPCAFRGVLNDRVDAYFASTGASRHFDARMVLKVLFYVGGFLGAYAWMMLGAHSLAAYVTIMVTLGLLIAGIGFNVAHDAAHAAFSSRRWLNRLVSHSFTLVGVHAYTWRILHNVIHHTYTNVPDADGDLNTVWLLRYYEDPRAPRRPFHRFQHVYCFALYSLASLVWVFRKDYMHMGKKEHCGYKKPTPPRVEWALLYGGKLLHYSMFLVAPWLLGTHSLARSLAGFVLMHLVAGICLALVFAVGHLVDEVAVVPVGPSGDVEDDWAVHQLRTTANFATRSRFFFWTVGGLNYQIEHHLFPTICHVHYAALAPIVQKTAVEFGLPYQSYASLGAALGGHVRFMRRYGAPLPAA